LGACSPHPFATLVLAVAEAATAAGTVDVMGIFKGPGEGGSGGKRGHRSMEHWGFNDEVKDAPRSRRRLDDRDLSKGEEESIDWMPLSGDRARRFVDEAIAEIDAGHELAGLDLTAVSKCPGCDDVLYRLGDESFAIVHLTWSGNREQPPWPQATKLGGFVAVDLAIAQHEH